MKVSMILIVAVTTIISANSLTSQEWDIRSLNSKYSEIEFLADILNCEKANNLVPNKTYVFSSILSLNSKQPVKIEVTGGEILKVLLNGNNLGTNRNGQYLLPLQLSHALLSVIVTPKEMQTIVSLQPADVSGLKMDNDLSKITLPKLDISLSRIDSSTVVASGFTNYASILQINGAVYGEVANTWSFLIPVQRNTDSLVFTLNSFLGTIQKSIQIPVVNKSVNNDVKDSSALLFANHSTIFLPIKDKRFNQPMTGMSKDSNHLVTNTNAEVNGTYPSIVLESQILDVETTKSINCRINAHDYQQWILKSGDSLLSNGSGTQNLKISASYFKNKIGLIDLTLESSKLSKKSNLFVVNSGELSVNYSKLFLASDKKDTISIIVNSSDSITFDIYSQDWYPVFSKKGYQTLFWDGITSSGIKVIKGTYNCVISTKVGDTIKRNHLQKITIAPQRVVSFITGKTSNPGYVFTSHTLYTNRDTFTIKTPDGSLLIDTVLSEGQHTLIINNDTITVIVDKKAPVILTPESMLVNTSNVKLFYTSDSVQKVIDTILPEGRHIIRISEKDSAGNVSTKDVIVVVDQTPPILKYKQLLVTKDTLLSIEYTVDTNRRVLDTILNEGVHVIEKTVSDSAGNFSTMTFTVVVDITPPILIVPDTVITNKNTVSLSYSTDGKPVTIDTTLSDGLHKLIISATDSVGNSNSKYVVIVIDKTAPVIDVPETLFFNTSKVKITYKTDTINKTIDTILTEGTHVITITESDRAGNISTKQVIIFVDTIPPQLTYTPDTIVKDTFVTIKYNVDGVTHSIDTVLQNGTHIITLSAIDNAGNRSEAHITVTVDSKPPAIAIISPKDNAVYNKTSFTIEWVIDSVHYTSDTILPEGIHKISRNASDAAGNSSIATIQVTVDITPPVLSIVAPVNGALLTKDIVHVIWTVDGVTYSSDTVMSEGTNSIRKIAVDSAGNSVEQSVTFTIDMHTIPVTITAPANNAFLNRSTVHIEWVVNSVKYQSDTILPEGIHTITRTALNGVGAPCTSTVTITIDTTPPKVVITNPSKDTIVSTASFSVNYTKDAVPQNRTVVLTPGENSVIISETDNAGNTGADTVKITYNSPVSVVIVSPGRDTIINTSTLHLVWVAGNVEHAIDTALSEGTHTIIRSAVSGEVTVSDTVKVTADRTPPVFVQIAPPVNAILFSNNGRVQISYSFDGIVATIDTLLPAGTVQIPLRNVDIAGNATDTIVRFIVDSPFPEIVVLKPGVLISSFQPEIVIHYNGGGTTGCNTATFRVVLDNIDVSSKFTTSTDSALWIMLDPDSLNNGAHYMIVSISNDALNSVSDTFNFNISRVKAEPGAKPDSGKAPLNVNFTTRATDPLGTIEWYRWDFNGDGVVDQQGQVARSYSYLYSTPGIYHPTLEVLSTTGQRDTVTLRVVVTKSLPSAFASIKPSNGPVPLSTTITGWGNGNGGYIKYHRYDIDGDGTTDTTIMVTPDTVHLLTEDFETSMNGWTPGGNSGVLDTVTWINDIDSIWTTNSVSGYYNNNMNEWMLSPEINIPSASSCTLSFWHTLYLYNMYGDTAHIEIDTGSGNFVSLIKYYSYNSAAQRLSCSQFAGKKIRLRFRLKTDTAITYAGWRIYNILLISSSGGINDTLLFDKVQNSPVQWTFNTKGDTWFKSPPTTMTYQNGLQKRWVETSPDTTSYRNNMDCWLTSPKIGLSNGAAGWFTFWSYMETYGATDGGTVEISRNNGPFQVFTPVGGYPDSITNRCRGFAGYRYTIIPVYDLSPFAGDSIQVRFRFYSDASYAYSRGWLIDSVRIYEIFPSELPDTSVVYRENFESGATGWSYGAASGSSSFGLDSITNNPDYAWTTTYDSANEFYDYMYMVSDSIILPPMHACSLSYWYRGNYSTGYIQMDTVGDGTFNYAGYLYTGESSTTIPLKTTGPNGDTIRIQFLYSGYNAGVNNYGYWLDNIAVTADSLTTAKDTLLFDQGNGSINWTLTSGYGHQWNRRNRNLSGSGSYWAELVPDSITYPKHDSSWLQSPVIYLPGGDLELLFDNYMNIQSYSDGGWLEISVNGGSYQRITPITPDYTTIYKAGGGYDSGFTGNYGWFTARYNLIPYGGSNVSFRFIFDSDTSNNTGEWIIDNIRICDTNRSTHISYTYASQGIYHPTFSVEDNMGGVATAPALMTNVYTLPAGSPSVVSNATPQNGIAPLKVTFTARATANGGTIDRYEWDFDGDTITDWSSTTSKDTTWTYRQAGTYVATIRVHSTNGLSCMEQHQINVDSRMTLSFEDIYADRTFNPYKNETMCATTTLYGDAPVTIYIRDRNGMTIRTLTEKIFRTNGTYNDCWDGRDEAGQVVAAGPYYAVLKYWVGTEERTLDLADSATADPYNPSRDEAYNFEVKPFDNTPLPLTFTIEKPSEVVLFIGLLNTADLRLRTLLNFEPMCAGTYTVYWDGLTDEGEIPYQYSGELLPGIWGYYFPDNCIWVQAEPPRITDLTINPSYFVPLNEACGPGGNMNGLTFNLTLSDSAALVNAKLYNVSTGTSVWEKTWDHVSAGAHSWFWDGKLLNGDYPDENIYRFGFTAEDRFGNRSMVRYNLMRTLYTFQVQSEEE